MNTQNALAADPAAFLLDRTGVAPAAGPEAPVADRREEWLFASLDLDNDGLVHPRDLESVLAEAGLSRDDPRVGETLTRLESAADGGAVTLGEGDYDRRTPLHLAAAEGHVAVVEFLLARGGSPGVRDRWGNTPLADARRHDRSRVVEVLGTAAATEGGDR